MNIVITGFMATGKTEISKALAKILKRNRVDTDDMVVEKTNMSINEIFARYGEEYFRNMETEIIHKAAEMEDVIISTGGGTVLRSENMEVLRNSGIIINLDADFSLIEKRLSVAAASRPLLRNSSIEEIKQRFENRKPFYDNCDYKISVSENKTAAEHAREMAKLLKEKGII